jgi:TPR repeat protein
LRSCPRSAAALMPGNGEACYRLAEHLESHEPTRVDEVAYWFGQACDRRHQPGCVRYADRLMEGQGVRREPDFANELYRKSCRAGVAEACNRYTEVEEAESSIGQR